MSIRRRVGFLGDSMIQPILTVKMLVSYQLKEKKR